MSGIGVDDVLLSLRRYMALGLIPADGWRIRVAREPIQDDERPVAVMETGRLWTPRRGARGVGGNIPSSPAGFQGTLVYSLPVTVSAYPSMGGTVREAARRARQLQQLMEQIATVGFDLGDGPRWGTSVLRPRSGPDRIPLYDYSGVDIEAADPALRAGPAEPITWLHVDDSGADAIQDPQDPRRWTVIWEMRATWEAPGQVPQSTVDAPIAQGMPGSGAGAP